MVGRLNRVALLVMLPAVVAHELTHAAFALPFGRVESITIVPPKATLYYPAGTPTPAIRLANLAPTLVGVLGGVPAMVWLITHMSPNIAVAGYLVGSWGVYTLPVSPEDRKPLEYAEPA